MRNFVILLLLVLLPQIAFSRFLSKDEAYVTIEDNTKLTVKKDGSTYAIFEEKKTLLSESARKGLNLLQLNYSENLSSVKVLEAKTIFDGKEYPVDMASIEDKTAANEPNGFSNNRQISIPFSNIQVGSSIYTKYSIYQKSSVKNQFFYFFDYGLKGYI